MEYCIIVGNVKINDISNKIEEILYKEINNYVLFKPKNHKFLADNSNQNNLIYLYKKNGNSYEPKAILEFNNYSESVNSFNSITKDPNLINIINNPKAFGTRYRYNFYLINTPMRFNSPKKLNKKILETMNVERSNNFYNLDEINENQNKTIIDLKNKLKKANETIKNQNKIINELQNKLNIYNDKINYYKNEINNLENNINKKEKELNDYISYLESELNNINKNTTKVDVKDIMAVNFISTDGNIHKAIPCIPSDTFAEVEEKLYQFFPEYRESNNTFLANGSTILRFKTISENKIGDGFPVILNT